MEVRSWALWHRHRSVFWWVWSAPGTWAGRWEKVGIKIGLGFESCGEKLDSAWAVPTEGWQGRGAWDGSLPHRVIQWP